MTVAIGSEPTPKGAPGKKIPMEQISLKQHSIFLFVLHVPEFNVKKCSVFLFLSLFLISFPLFSANTDEDFRKGLFTRIQHLPCGKTDIVITTSCLYRNEGEDVYCFNQNISFLKKHGDIIRNANYNAPFLDENQPFVWELSGIPAKEKFYLLARNGNFGNCQGCEWDDLFTEEGVYQGSTSWERSAVTNFKPRSPPKKLHDSIVKVRYGENKAFYDKNRVVIIRMPLSEEKNR